MDEYRKRKLELLTSICDSLEQLCKKASPYGFTISKQTVESHLGYTLDCVEKSIPTKKAMLDRCTQVCLDLELSSDFIYFFIIKFDDIDHAFHEMNIRYMGMQTLLEEVPSHEEKIYEIGKLGHDVDRWTEESENYHCVVLAYCRKEDCLNYRFIEISPEELG
jgi:hypothetical protein